MSSSGVHGPFLTPVLSQHGSLPISTASSSSCCNLRYLIILLNVDVWYMCPMCYGSGNLLCRDHKEISASVELGQGLPPCIYRERELRGRGGEWDSSGRWPLPVCVWQEFLFSYFLKKGKKMKNKEHLLLNCILYSLLQKSNPCGIIIIIIIYPYYDILHKFNKFYINQTLIHLTRAQPHLHGVPGSGT